MTTHYHYREQPGAGAQSPLIFTFHGTGGDENQFFAFAGELVPGAHVVSPRGDVSEGGALRYFRRTGEGVYDMDDLAIRTAAMAEFVAGFTAAARGPVLGLGYSNGANILANVMITRPELFDAAVLLHPLIPFEPDPAPGLKDRQVLITAGRQDPICPPPLTERLIGWLGAQGAAVTPHWHDGGHEVRDSEIAAVQDFVNPYRTG